MRTIQALWVLAGLLLVGCAASVPEPALKKGDVVRPQILFAPAKAWPANVKGAVGIWVEVHRPGREGVSFLHEKDIPWQGVEMEATITFLGNGPLGEPLSVPFVRDC